MDQRVNNTRKSKKHSQIKVVTRWDYKEEVTPAFKRLMALLLKPRDSQSVETATTDEEHQNGQ